MSAIRPSLPAPTRLSSAASAAVRPTAAEPVKSAQRAFFQAALDTAAPAAQPRMTEQPRRVEAKPLDRLPRPGSVLDIRV